MRAEAMTKSGGAPQAPKSRGASTCIVATQPLDRAAYRSVIQTTLCWPVAMESDFTPVSIWTMLRARPGMVVAIADLATREVCDAIEMIARLDREVRLLGIAGVRVPTQLELWGRCPVHGLITKDAVADELLAALQAVADGRHYFPSVVAASLRRSRDNPDPVTRLSRREEELLPLLARGMTLRDAASALNISYKTADSYRSHLLKKLELRDRVELVRYAIRKGIVEP